VRNVIIFVFMLTVGAGLGLYIGWVAAPRAAAATLASLRPSAKDEQVLMIAAAYARDQNLSLARSRLGALGFSDPGPAIVDTAQRTLAAQSAPPDPATGSGRDLRFLAQLAAACNTFSPVLQPYLP